MAMIDYLTTFPILFSRITLLEFERERDRGIEIPVPEVVVAVLIIGELSRVSSPASMVLILGSEELWERAPLL